MARAESLWREIARRVMCMHYRITVCTRGSANLENPTGEIHTINSPCGVSAVQKTNNPEVSLQPRLIGIKAAAVYLGATVWAMRSLVWNREVPSLRIGNRVLFDKKDLDAYVEMQKTAVAR